MWFGGKHAPGLILFSFSRCEQHSGKFLQIKFLMLPVPVPISPYSRSKKKFLLNWREIKKLCKIAVVF